MARGTGVFNKASALSNLGVEDKDELMKMSAAIGEDCGATMTTKEIMKADAKAFKKIHHEVCDTHHKSSLNVFLHSNYFVLIYHRPAYFRPMTLSPWSVLDVTTCISVHFSLQCTKLKTSYIEHILYVW